MGGGGGFFSAIPIISDIFEAFAPEPPTPQVIYQQPAQQVLTGAEAEKAIPEKTKPATAEPEKRVEERTTGATRRRAASRSRTILSDSSTKQSILG
jgi:hypothetical protein